MLGANSVLGCYHGYYYKYYSRHYMYCSIYRYEAQPVSAGRCLEEMLAGLLYFLAWYYN